MATVMSNVPSVPLTIIQMVVVWIVMPNVNRAMAKMKTIAYLVLWG
jgi:hypothetical protein